MPPLLSNAVSHFARPVLMMKKKKEEPDGRHGQRHSKYPCKLVGQAVRHWTMYALERRADIRLFPAAIAEIDILPS